MKGTLPIKNVRHLMTCDADDRLLDGVSVFIRDGVIESVEQNGETAADVIDASNMAMYPGLINTHHHLYWTFNRNLPQVQNMELLPWLKTLYEIWKHVDEDVVYHSSLTGMGELLKAGCTTYLDHHYVFLNTVESGFLDAQFHAADELGMRFYVTKGSVGLSVRDGGLPPNSMVQSMDEIPKDSEEAVARHRDGSRYSVHQVALAPCSPFSVTGELLRESAVLARKLKVKPHTHLTGTKDEEQYTLSRLDMRPLEYMGSLGWVGSDVWYAHGMHFTEGELKCLANTGTGVTHCPVSNMKLFSGVALIPQMLKLGVPVGLAVDRSASNDGSNLLEGMRVIYLLHRLSWGQEASDGYDILKMATRGSTRILGREGLRHIGVGMAADFFLVDLNHIEMVGAQFDPKSVLCTVGLKGCVDYTVVNGKIAIRDGRLTGVDEEKIVEKASAVVEEYISR